jgi:hypothetical protein
MGRLTGIEPASTRATIWRVNHFTTTAILIITYCYRKDEKNLVEGDGFEPPNPKERIYSPPRLATSLPLRISLT